MCTSLNASEQLRLSSSTGVDSQSVWLYVALWVMDVLFSRVFSGHVLRIPSAWAASVQLSGRLSRRACRVSTHTHTHTNEGECEVQSTLNPPTTPHHITSYPPSPPPPASSTAPTFHHCINFSKQRLWGNVIHLISCTAPSGAQDACVQLKFETHLSMLSLAVHLYCDAPLILLVWKKNVSVYNRTKSNDHAQSSETQATWPC